MFAVWTDDKVLGALHNRHDVTAICAIPWLPEDIARWTRAMNPADLRTGRSGPSTTISLAPPVLEALREMTLLTNLETGLSHPTDHDSAVDAFLLLRSAGFSWNAEDVHVWALQNGWISRGAEELSEIARKIAKGSTLPHRFSRWSTDAVERWMRSGPEDDSDQ
ncbi:MAG: hypothetical protein EOO70_08695 [Myxococcaceae bacterium]|nr:MAG: hypothetical protein EOO70_08695 [Myxococcaceae bacterium]